MNTQARARHTDPDTSHAAASTITKNTNEVVRERVISIHETYASGLADFELEDIYHHLHGGGDTSTVRTRRSELAQMGVIDKTGEKRRNPAGRPCTVWAISSHIEKEQCA